MRPNRIIIFAGLISFCAAAFLLHCSVEPLIAGPGNTSETQNGCVFGSVKTQYGLPAENTEVMLVPSEYDPVKGVVPKDRTFARDTTDANGNYAFSQVFAGSYTIETRHLSDQTRGVVWNISLQKDSIVTVPANTLQRTGCMKITLPDSLDTLNGYLYVPGTGLRSFLSENSPCVVFDSVPATMVPVVLYSARNTNSQKTIRFNIPVSSLDTAIVTMPGWCYAKTLLFNTTLSGANVSGDVYNFPVLVRLSSANFDFSQAQAHGEDLRFTKSDGRMSLLPYEIERWDPQYAEADVWVRIDTVRGNNSAQAILMFWGNQNASDASNGGAVFDTANGFEGVWHLSQQGNAPSPDATNNRYDGVPLGMTPGSAVQGVIGTAQRFDGAMGCITMPNTAGSKLNFAEDASYTLSAWVYAETLDTLVHMIAGKGHEQYYMDLKYNQGAPKWEMVEYGNSGSALAWKAAGDTIPVKAREWHYIVGVHIPIDMFIYNNGAFRMFRNWIREGDSTLPRNTGEDFSIGRQVKSVQSWWEQGYCSFNGVIDEVRISRVAHGSDWIKLEYMNQKPDGDKLVSYQ